MTLGRVLTICEQELDRSCMIIGPNNSNGEYDRVVSILFYPICRVRPLVSEQHVQRLVFDSLSEFTFFVRKHYLVQLRDYDQNVCYYQNLAFIKNMGLLF